MSLFRSALKDFDPPRVSEAVFGIAAKFFRHSSAKNSSELHKWLFGYTTTELAVRYPGGLATLQRRMPRFWGAPKEVVDRHTIYPLFRVLEASAKDARRVEALLIRARKNPGQRLRRLFELQAGDVWEKRQLPRYCVACMIEDQRSGRVPTWYRQHQIPGVDWCTRHQAQLLDFCLACGDNFFKHSYVLPAFHCGCDKRRAALLSVEEAASINISEWISRLMPENDDDHQQLRLCDFAVGLLQGNLEPISQQQWEKLLLSATTNTNVHSHLAELERLALSYLKILPWHLSAERSVLRGLHSGGSAKAYFELTAKGKLMLLCVLFDSADQFILSAQSSQS